MLFLATEMLKLWLCVTLPSLLEPALISSRKRRRKGRILPRRARRARSRSRRAAGEGRSEVVCLGWDCSRLSCCRAEQFLPPHPGSSWGLHGQREGLPLALLIIEGLSPGYIIPLFRASFQVSVSLCKMHMYSCDAPKCCMNNGRAISRALNFGRVFLT